MKVLSNPELAMIASKLLVRHGGFTLDAHGQSVEGDLWAVSVNGREERFHCFPSIREIVDYLDQNLPSDSNAYFGGWKDDHGVCYLDHTLVFSHRHTAVHEGKRQQQKAICYLKTKEVVLLSPAPIAQEEEISRYRISFSDDTAIIRQAKSTTHAFRQGSEHLEATDSKGNVCVTEAEHIIGEERGIE